MTRDPHGIVFEIKRYALHDGPGIRTTVFLKGCPLACAWCHNPEGLSPAPEVAYHQDRCWRCGSCVASCDATALVLSDDGVIRDVERCSGCGDCVDACPAQAREPAGRAMPASEVMAEVLRDQLFYDESGGGVTFSGGEPLAQPEFLLALLEACGRQELHRIVDTSGFAPWETLAAVAAHTDLFLYDLKHMDAAVHQRATGVGNQQILDNLRRLVGLEASIIVRLPLIPGFNDDAATIGQLCDLLTERSLGTLHLLPYHSYQVAKYRRFDRAYDGDGWARAPGRTVAEVADQIRAAGVTVEVGG